MCQRICFSTDLMELGRQIVSLTQRRGNPIPMGTGRLSAYKGKNDCCCLQDEQGPNLFREDFLLLFIVFVCLEKGLMQPSLVLNS